MSHEFFFRDGLYHCEGVSVADIADTVGTPCFIYSKKFLGRRCAGLKAAFADHPTLFCYAVKANSNLSILQAIGAHDFGADVVSIGEIERARLAGILPQKIVFSGVGKREDEIAAALATGILSFNVESLSELQQIAKIAATAGKCAQVVLRVNPNVDAKTHKKIATGLYSTKFGLPEAELAAAYTIIKNAGGNLQLKGLACHIGSQLMDLTPITDAARRMRALVEDAESAGFQIEFLNLGGGVGIAYGGESAPTAETYAQALLPVMRGMKQRLVLEPGRFIVGDAGILLTRVLHVKQNPERRFVIVDAAMTELIRPTLYEAAHRIFPAKDDGNRETWRHVDIVGPVCETGDFLGLDRSLAEVGPGDLLAVATCGAYAASMASTYNSRPLCAEVLVENDSYAIVRRHQQLASLWQDEALC